LDPKAKAKAKDLSHKAKAKAKDLDFGLKDQGQGQGLTSLVTEYRVTGEATPSQRKESLKSVHICQSYHKNKCCTFLWPTV